MVAIDWLQLRGVRGGGIAIRASRGGERSKNRTCPTPTATIRDMHAAVRAAFLAKADAERELGEAVAHARTDGHSWAAIGAMLDTSGEAARQRHSQRAIQS